MIAEVTTSSHWLVALYDCSTQLPAVGVLDNRKAGLGTLLPNDLETPMAANRRKADFARGGERDLVSAAGLEKKPAC
ncbi:MAG: hypothetical protein KA435_06480 [Azonexus sp.]|nr:hypothetical protein [Azonexus sp.]